MRVFYACPRKGCGFTVKTNGDMSPIQAHMASHEAP